MEITQPGVSLPMALIIVMKNLIMLLFAEIVLNILDLVVQTNLIHTVIIAKEIVNITALIILVFTNQMMVCFLYIQD